MAWTVHKPANCLPGKQHKEDQKKKPHKANSGTFCCCHFNCSKSLICRPHGLNCRPGRVTMRASMDVFIYDISIHGWANSAYRTPSCLPLSVHHAISAPMPLPSRLPDRSRAPQDNIQCLCPREYMAVAAPREKNSFHPQAPPQEEEARRVFAEGSDHQIKTWDLPCPSRGLRLQSWLLCGRTVGGITRLSPSEGDLILSPTNLHRSVKRS